MDTWKEGSCFGRGIYLYRQDKTNGSEHMNRSHHGAHLCIEGDEGGLAGGDVVFGCDKVVCGVLLVDADLPSLDRCVVARRRLLSTTPVLPPPRNTRPHPLHGASWKVKPQLQKYLCG